jgi:hypothetical protein
MPPGVGTRTKRSFRQERVTQGHMTRTFTRDLGMTKLVTASITFTSSNGRATGANGTFPTSGFIVGDDVLIEGANLNNGYFHITGLDATNQSYLVLDPPPANEGPITVTLRTP